MTGKNSILGMLAWEVLPIVGTYYLLRAFGVSQYLALLIGTAAGVVRVAYVALSQRKFDSVAAFTCMVFGIGMALSFLAGDARMILAIKSLTTVAAGCFFAFSALAGRPALYGFAKRYAGETEETYKQWDALYDKEPGFRRVYYTMTWVWATAMFAEALVRLPLIWWLPLDISTALSTVLLIGTIVATSFWTLYYGGTRGGAFTKDLAVAS